MVSSSVISPIPDFSASREASISLVSIPIEDIIPNPVIKTRCDI